MLQSLLVISNDLLFLLVDTCTGFYYCFSLSRGKGNDLVRKASQDYSVVKYVIFFLMYCQQYTIGRSSFTDILDTEFCW